MRPQDPRAVLRELLIGTTAEEQTVHEPGERPKKVWVEHAVKGTELGVRIVETVKALAREALRGGRRRDGLQYVDAVEFVRKTSWYEAAAKFREAREAAKRLVAAVRRRGIPPKPAGLEGEGDVALAAELPKSGMSLTEILDELTDHFGGEAPPSEGDFALEYEAWEKLLGRARLREIRQAALGGGSLSVVTTYLAPEIVLRHIGGWAIDEDPEAEWTAIVAAAWAPEEWAMHLRKLARTRRQD